MGTRWNSFTNNFDLVNATDSLVVGPAVSTDNAVVRFDGTTGKIIQNSGVIISDSDAMSGAASIALDIGATIDEFSTDGTLSGDSDTALPTEKAVKTYVDNSSSSPLTTKNDLYYYNTADARLPGPSNMGQVLVVDIDDNMAWYSSNEVQIVNFSHVAAHSGHTGFSGTGSALETDMNADGYGWQLTSGTTSSGVSHVRYDQDLEFRGAAGDVRMECTVQLDQLSNATDEYEFQFGWHDRWRFATGQTDGTYFLYDRGTDGANWRAVCRDSSTATNTDTSTAVGTGLTHLAIEIDNTASSVTFYIDGTLVATTTTNIPTSGDAIAYASFLLNTAGTGSGRVAHVYSPKLIIDNT